MTLPNISPRPAYRAQDVPFTPGRPVSAIIIGAGIAGVATGVLLQKKVPNISITIFDRNSRVGGTWEENRYPGVRCDVPSHSYQLSFEPNPSWTEVYAQGPEIRDYYESVAHKYDIHKLIRFNSEITRAEWSSKTSTWTVTILDLSTGDTTQHTADFLVSAAGRLNSAELPKIQDLHTFAGPVAHTAAWDESLEYEGKRVAIIGNGASGMQILPNILPKVREIHHFARTRNWVSPYFKPSFVEATSDNFGGEKYSQQQRQEFEADPAKYLEYRRNIEVNFHTTPKAIIAHSKESDEFRASLTNLMSSRVGQDRNLLEKLIPSYAPGCKRLTPAPGYLEALRDPKVSYITENINRAVPEGLVTEDGELHDVDVIIAATGFPSSHAPRFPTIGREGTDLREAWGTNGLQGYPTSYLGVMTPRFPNYFFVMQVQGTSGGGTVPVHCELTATYIAKCIRKIQSQSYSSLEPRQDATEEFNTIVEGYWSNKVTTDDCASWWKTGPGNARVVVAWPGSGHHRWDNLREPRWEDYHYVRRVGSEENRFDYFGNGDTQKEQVVDTGRLTRYLQAGGKIDIEHLHEDWTQMY